MGTFGNSFSRELGKNTGKVVSNALFKDKWSTPHRITSTVKVAEIKSEQARLEAEASRRKAQLEYDTQIDKLKLEQKFEKEKNEAKLLEDIIKTSFTNDNNNNYQVLTELWSLVQSHESENIKNAAISKIEDGIFRMKQIGLIDEAAFFEKRLIDYNEKNLNEQKKKKMMNTILFIVGIIIAIPVLYYLYKSQQGIQHMLKSTFENIFN